ncbi:S8 family peptidase [Aquirufa ecclesiirivi]|uniref:S8 family peptidase n=1 Tax=Aquirufa ecclesiirivi TaxID=2715124 RepID=UPI0023D7BF1B|nr:S8 family peptidase [Aquirufa ecclesiirivi]MDF0693093.1 S8 family peptidase [Aquirufa ecclesiirivi]
MKSLFAILLLAAFTFSCQMQLDELALSPNANNGNSSAPGLVQQGNSGKSISNEILIQFKRGTSESGKLTAIKAITGTIQEQIVTQEMKDEGDEGFYVVKTNINAIEAINRASKNSLIEIAELNQLYTHQQTSTTPDDLYYSSGQLWGLNGTYGSNANVAWANNNTGSSTVYVGVVDEGVMFNHPDLVNNMWSNPNEIVDGLDNDRNGFIDDVRGWDFANNDASVYDGVSSNDVDAHGTHVSGTIGGLGNNSIGVVGMNWNVKIIPAKFMGPAGGSTANAIKALDYLTNLKKTKRINIVASNNSWGGGAYSKLLLSAIQRADRGGILFVVAAGNAGSNIDLTPSYPASYTTPNVIAVSAIDVDGLLPTWSSYGVKSVALGAPGANIISTVPGPNGVGYAAYSGTSMATPHVAAAVALYAAKNYPTSTNQSASQVIKKAIINNTNATPSLNGKTISGGRLNVGVVGFY